MKKLLTVLLVALVTLLPNSIMAVEKKKVTSIDITIPLPKGGMTIQDGEQIKITAAKTVYGDLVKQGIV